MDFFIGFVGIIIALIPFFLVAIFIKISSRGPVFYTQKRIGKNGKEFTLYKFRTLLNGKEKLWRELDPGQTTKIGVFLRKTNIDELPQLINLIKGDITLIGPRPDWFYWQKNLKAKFRVIRKDIKLLLG